MRDQIRRIALVVVVFAGCLGALGARAQHAGAGHGGGEPVVPAYVCGNRFVVTNAGPAPVIVGFRVAGTAEGGSVRLEAAPDEDPGFSEALIETRNPGTVEIYVNRRQVGSAQNEREPCAPARAPARAAAATTSLDAGEWGAQFSWPVVAVHLHLLPNGRVLSWGKSQGGVPQIWNPATGAFTPSPSPDLLFCAGHALLQDGRLLVAGGHIDNYLGLPDINLFRFGTSDWAGATPMQRGRWYPTVTTMAFGQAVILAGTDETGLNVPLPEVWASGKLRVLTGASRELPYYPRAFLAPNGRLFYAGEAGMTRYLDIGGTGRWITVGPRKVAGRNYGSAVMYEPGKILYAGGGYTTNTAEVIDLTQAAPKWQFTAPMAFARRHHNLTILPTGEVLATDGVAGTIFNDLTKAVLAAEIWSPATGTWRTVASSTVPRGYHGTAILLPDGRVLQAGSGEGANTPQQRNAELYSPPYLFAGPRPTIATAPNLALYGTTIRVTTPEAAAITKVSLIRLGSVTHAFNMNQRYQTLDFTSDATGLTVTAPSSRNLTPPGHYMLFILDASGVPSVAKIVQVR